MICSQTLVYLGMVDESKIRELGDGGIKIMVYDKVNRYDSYKLQVEWNRGSTSMGIGTDWDSFHPLVTLAHELGHAHHHVMAIKKHEMPGSLFTMKSDYRAAEFENQARKVFFDIVPGYKGVQYPRPWPNSESYGVDASTAWRYWSNIPGWRYPDIIEDKLK